MADTVPATADPGADDDSLAAQPIGYWSGTAHDAVVGRLRDTLATIDVTQPQWWVLTRVGAPTASTRAEVAAQLAEVAADRHEIPRSVDQLLHRGWVAADTDGRLSVTDAGEQADYVVTLKVLRRMIGNSAGRTP
jgi:hypothetical protein